jgi:hypothetical protein
MDFIVEQSAKNAVAIEKLLESQRKAELRFYAHDSRFDRDERMLKLMIKADRRARREMRERDNRLDRRMTEIAEFQAHSDRRLDALIDIVRARENGRSS